MKNFKPAAPSIKIEPLSLDKIFYGDKAYLTKLPQDKLITLVSTGDIIPARMVNLKAAQKNDFLWPFQNVWQLLSNADFTVSNLESPLMKNCIASGEGMTFCGSDKNIQGLAKAGIDLVSLANNHADNYGSEGIAETKNLLQANQIQTVEAGKLTTATIKNVNFGFLSYNFLIATDSVMIARDVQEAKKSSDFLIVMPHWGEEYQEIPNVFEKEMQKILLENGADMILGNHPHIIQPIAIDDGKFTIFAHGNFIFDQMWSEETKKGIVLKIFIYEGRVIDAEVVPIYIEDFGQPRILIGEEREEILSNLYKLSKRYIQSL